MARVRRLSHVVRNYLLALRLILRHAQRSYHPIALHTLLKVLYSTSACDRLPCKYYLHVLIAALKLPLQRIQSSC